eukprot:gene7999-9842_t
MSGVNINFDFDSIQEIDLNEDHGGYMNMNGGGGGTNKFNQQHDVYYEDIPMFNLERVDYRPNGIQAMLVSNEKLIIATVHSHIIRLDFKSPNDLEEIDFTRKPDERIYKIFLDPTGNHLIISMENEEVYYLHSSWKKPKLQKWKVNLIDSIAWDVPSESSPVQTILIGNNRGRIFETVVSGVEKGYFDFSNKEPIIKPLYTFEDSEPILGMILERVHNRQYFLIISTPTRLYYLIGPSFEQLFDRDHIIFDIVADDMSSNRYGEINYYSKSVMSRPQSYAWMIGSGIHFGDLVYGSQNTGDKFTTSTMMLHFRQDNFGGDKFTTSTKKRPDHPTIPPHPPISFALSQFHFLLLYEDRFIALCKLNFQIVYEYIFNPKEVRLRGITVDHVQNTTWIYGDNIVYELKIIDEDRDAWRLYMEKGQYETALSFAKEPYADKKRDQIWATQADHYFNENKFELAANFYGMTHRVFEEITLKFINANQRDALKTFLLQKLNHLNARDETQKTIICTWLVEIFISKLNTLRNPSDTDKYNKVNSEFRQFLDNSKDTLTEIKDIVFNIISSHGAIDELLFYAKLIEDNERVISYHIQHQQYETALKILTTLDKPKVPPSKSNHHQQQSGDIKPPPEELYYKFCPVLFHFIPYQTCESWMQPDKSFLNPRKLIPSLMRYDHSKTPSREPNQAIKYLQYCVQRLGNKDRAVHNYLLSLYVKQSDERPLLEFLNSKDAYYDLKYALRLCMKERKLKSCVLIYSAMRLYEEAVDLSLEVDIKLAKENADKVKDEDEALCKKLWLRIARHVVEKDNNIKEAMEFLKHCPLLKIEDILPFFPDFTVIDDFKVEICKSLEDYNSYIEVLKAEMDDATNSADLIRKDIQNLRNKYGYVKSDQKCEICNYPVLTKRFYLFSCQHVFHSDCLITELMKHLNSDMKQRVRELQMSISNQSSGSYKQSGSSGNNPNAANASNTNNMNQDETISQEDLNKIELDRIVGKECIYCGDIMIRSIEKPFIGLDEDETLASWEI